MITNDEMTKKLESIDLSKETIVAYIKIEQKYIEDIEGDYCFFGIYGDMVSIVKKEYFLHFHNLRKAVECNDSETLEKSDYFYGFDISEEELRVFYTASIISIDSLKEK